MKAAADDDEVCVLEDALADAIADVAPVGRERCVSIIAEPLSSVVRGDRRGVARLFRNVIERPRMISVT